MTYRIEQIMTKPMRGHEHQTVRVYAANVQAETESAALEVVASMMDYPTFAELARDLQRAPNPSVLRAVAQ